MMRSGTLTRRLAAGYAVVLGLAVLVGISALVALRDLREASEKMRVESEDVVETMRLAALAHEELAVGRAYLIKPDERLLRDIHDLDAQGTALLDRRRARVDGAEGAALLDELAAADHELTAAFEAFVTAHRGDAPTQKD